MNTPTSVNMNKSTEHTVFVRFHPPSSILRRHHVEDYFSQIGPIKKASLIIPKQQQHPQDGGSSSSYGFIKYTCESDAVDAASKLNKSTLTVSEQKFQVVVELASTVQQKQQQQPMGSSQSPTTTTTEHQKKHNRVILRNLSFYATSRNVQDALQRQFGTIVDVHIPMVQGNKSRGFAFCTFDKTKDAQKAVDAKELEIKGRKATIQWSVSKRVHQQQQQDALKQQRKQEYQEKVLSKENQQTTTTKTQQQGEEKEHEDKDKNDEVDSSSDDSSDSSDSDSEDDDGCSSDSSSESDDDDGSDSDDDDKSMEDDDEEERDPKKSADNQQNLLQKPVQEQRQLFIRNLPFDATRHDVFETFRTYGTIEAIYLVTDPTTKLPRGTAFVTYEKPAGAARALRNNKDNPILLKGRPLLMDHAVDKETANTLATARDSNNDNNTTKKVVGKDKRNFYLRGEGRVDDEEEWAAISDAEKNKRQRAWHDKITKLKSPLFFMNAHRLSIRNISKSVDEAAIKQLLFQATKRGLERKLVSIDDLVAEWTASGEYSARDILEKRKQYQRKDKHVHSGIEALPDQDNCLKVASLDERNIKRSIPSVYLDRDFAAAGGSGTKNAKNAPSRGFAFAEFTHHVQALACLRELNNNTRYTEEYAAGGKAAAGALEAQKRSKKKKTEDEAVKLPRIIVEFTVENRAKAKQQAEHRAQQQANRQKQKLQTKEKRAAANSNESGSNDKGAKSSSSKSRKLGRGAKQREKKRQRKLEGDDEKTEDTATTKKPDKASRKRKNVEMEQQQQRKPKEIKPPKKPKKGKRKELEAEEKLSKLVKNHHNDDNTSSKDKSAAAAAAPRKEALSSGKRWFD